MDDDSLGSAEGEWGRTKTRESGGKKERERGDCMNAHEGLLILSARPLCLKQTDS